MTFKPVEEVEAFAASFEQSRGPAIYALDLSKPDDLAAA